MRLVALISGGKDSCFNMLQCVAAGHEIVALANLQPTSKDELDSFMYQTVGHQGVSLYGEAMGLPLFRENTCGIAHHHKKWYTPTDGDEVEDLYNLLSRVKEAIHIDGVASGAVLSDYQRLRVENVCSRLGLVSVAYMWRRDQGELLNEMMENNVDAIVIKVAALGLDPRTHLGMHLPEIYPHLIKMNQKYGLNICGEGGEYETFTLDCPLFRKRIVTEEYEIVIQSDDHIAPVGYLNFKKLSLVDKYPNPDKSNCDLDQFSLCGCAISSPLDYISDLDSVEDELGSSSSSEEAIPTASLYDSVSIDSYNDCTDVRIYEKNNLENVSINTSGWCWLSFIVGNDEQTSAAMLQALNKLSGLLSANSYSISDLVSVILYVRDMKSFSEINAIYMRAVNKLDVPVRACVEVPLPDRVAVLMEAVAFKSTRENGFNGERKSIHVQSISHWAPASIGPYSQSVKIGDIIYVAGQIALVPGSMKMIEDGIRRECRLSLRHIGRIISASDSNTQMRDVVQGTCYVTDREFIHPARQEWERRTNNAIVDYIVVSTLPRNAKVEWHVWAHRGNTRFQYEETGSRIDRRYKLFLRRRFNYENTVSAVVCYLSADNATSTDSDIANIVEDCDKLCDIQLDYAIEYVLRKLTSGEPEAKDRNCVLRLFYCAKNPEAAELAYQALEKRTQYSPNFSFTIIPVHQLHHRNTILSICAIRHS